eukprot:756848_1
MAQSTSRTIVVHGKHNTDVAAELAIAHSMSLEDLKSAKSSYFCIGKQYIFCGKHKKSYCDEEMKVSTFDKNLIHIIKNIPLTIWKEMFDDHWMDRDGYFSQLRGNITLI